MRKFKKAILVNKCYSDNLGDQAIAQSANKLLKELGFIDVCCHDYTSKASSVLNRKQTKGQGSLKSKVKQLLPLKLIWTILNVKRIHQTLNVSDSKYLFIGGGQLVLSNTYFPIAAFLWVFIAKRLGYTCIYLNVGAGTKFTRLDERLFNYSLKKSDLILVRDDETKEILDNKFGVRSYLTGDVVFTEKKERERSLIRTKTVGVAIPGLYVFNTYNDKLTRDAYFEKWLGFLEENKIDLNDVELFHTTYDDLVESRLFSKYVLGKYKVKLDIKEASDINTLNNILNNYGIVISGRMHALIMGIQLGCKPLVFPISEKLISFQSIIDKEKNLDFYSDCVRTKTLSQLSELIRV
ncbi:hypothetical protein BCU90_07610 [Vibrio lentus]|uniref:polysaccharide pyruvyl transferase family protein n=1 Tax=Vibrio TaxID=662 RepID=UPI000C855BFD|nr:MULTISPECIES: polysaccharide pyruvyl transferase family protein [Vibrio]MDN2667522.1 polysaccharide pyruvyl transferase family protein [Vibrio sp. 14N.309.X.WAT.E.F5]PMG48444.1 hypothetical protein BCU90_07610 [Vibrio lentus]